MIGPGAVIGAPGFGYEAPVCHRDCSSWDDFECCCGQAARHQYRSHTAGVIIERDVHIGANANVAQGRHRPTIIREGARVDALVHIGHNVEIGRNALVVALSMLGGTSTVGDGGYVASATVRDHVDIGAGGMAGLGSVVTKSIPDGETWAGVPAKRLEPKPAPDPHVTEAVERWKGVMPYKRRLGGDGPRCRHCGQSGLPCSVCP